MVTVHQLKTSVDTLANSTSVEELGHIVQAFFNRTYNIPTRHTSLHIRRSDKNPAVYAHSALEHTVEQFFTTLEPQTHALIEQTKILSYDEINFDQFYEHSSNFDPIISLLDTIGADIFIPIYLKRKMIAYIIIKRNARDTNTYYTDAELHEMLLFASYLSNIIAGLQHHNFEKIAQHSKALRDMLHTKNQEIALFKESIRTCVNHKAHTAPGIILYHNRRFTFENQRAHQLIDIDPNEQIAHPLAQKLKQLVLDVYRYKTAQAALITTQDEKRILLNATQHIDTSDIIITVEHPDISDILLTSPHKIESSLLWEYILHLETTSAGKILHELIPSGSQRMVELKIELMRASICNKPLMIELPTDDAFSVATTIHMISKRTKIHTINLESEQRHEEIRTLLFGKNPLLEDTNRERCLLEALHGIGTLHIHNPHLLSNATQLELAEFLKTGYYTPSKSDTQMISDTRIIFTTDKPILDLVQSNALIPELYTHINSHILMIPPLTDIPQEELLRLIEGIWSQLIHDKPYNQMLAINEYEKTRIMKKNCVSIYALKIKLQHLLAEKMRRVASNEPAEGDLGAQSVEHETLGKIAELGKHALKDPELMTTLWNTFKSQNKIATLLKVNRSSVNRRCKEYNLI
jgi:transcriptional regulator of aromatic amino acid metabolism